MDVNKHGVGLIFDSVWSLSQHLSVHLITPPHSIKISFTFELQSLQNSATPVSLEVTCCLPGAKLRLLPSVNVALYPMTSKFTVRLYPARRRVEIRERAPTDRDSRREEARIHPQGRFNEQGNRFGGEVGEGVGNARDGALVTG